MSKKNQQILALLLEISIAAVAGTGLIVAVAVFFYRRNKMNAFEHKEIEVNDSSNTATTTTNPLHSMTDQEDDPFAVDFVDN